MHKNILFKIFGGLVLTFVSAVGAAQALPFRGLSAPHFDHVIWIVLENASYKTAMQQPFLNTLFRHGALLENFTAETHPSQGNYIAMISGDTFGVHSDENVTINNSHIGDLLEARGRSWGVYAEQYPGNCFLGSGSGLYARKHVPFMSFANIQSSPVRCAHIVNASRFEQDIKSGQLPNFAMYTPDLNDDGHNTGVHYADQWLSRTMLPLLTNGVLMQRTLFIVTFDEDDLFSGNHIYTVLYGAGIPEGIASTGSYNHYSLLRLIEDEWSLGTLGRGDLHANVLTGLWK